MCEWSAPDGESLRDVVVFRTRAQEPTKCDECDGVIPVGAVYRGLTGRDPEMDAGEDEVEYATCEACVAIIDEFAKAHDGGRPYLQGLSEALGECIEEETTINDDDTETLTESGKRWQKALDEMHARRAAGGAT